MIQNEPARERPRTAEEPLVVAKVPEGFRVYSPTGRTRPYLVTGTPDEPMCTCPDFRARADDPRWRCRHILAAFREHERTDVQADPQDELYQEQERAALQDGGDNGGRNRGPHGITQMLLKRSVSPDGRIDSLSIEFSCAADGEPMDGLAARADEVLRIQAGIAQAFLQQNGRAKPESRPAPSPVPGGGVAARLLRVGGADGRFGRRLFITVSTGDRMLRLYGTRKQLADHVARAGFPDLADELAEGVTLNVPCRIVTKAARDGGFVNIDSVLPAQGTDRGTREAE